MADERSEEMEGALLAVLERAFAAREEGGGLDEETQADLDRLAEYAESLERGHEAGWELAKGEDEGRWVTVGGREGEDGKRHGGSPVFIVNGRIVKGAPRLTGKKVDSLGKGEGKAGGEEAGPTRPAYSGPRHPRQVEAAWGRYDSRAATAKGGGLFGGEDMQARRGFAALPEGAPVLFTAGEFEGKTGKIVRDKAEGNRVAAEVDGRPGLVPIDPSSVEPLNGSLSWRTETASGPTEQKPLYTADQFLPKRKGEAPAAAEEEDDPATHRQQLNREREYRAAVWRKKARKAGIDPKHLEALAGDIRAHDAAHVEDRKSLLKEAKAALKRGGYDPGALTTNLRSGRVEDEIPALDEVAEHVAERYPHQFHGHPDAGGRLLDLFAEGTPRPMSADDAYGQALEQLREQGAGAAAGGGGGDEDDFPFGANVEDEIPLSLAGADDLAERVEAAAAETDTDPSPEQKAANNYRKGKFHAHGLRFAVESPRGSTRSGVGADGKPWSVEMKDHYGYILRTESEADGDHVDVFIGPRPESEIVFVVDQVKPSGRFDEHKCMLGYTSEREAREAYLRNYSPGWKGLGGITALTMPQFLKWLEGGDTGKPLAGRKVELALPSDGWVELAFDESEHPRGQPENAGEFAPAGGAATAEAPASENEATAAAPPGRPGKKPGAARPAKPQTKSGGRLDRFRSPAVRRRVLHGLRNEAELAKAIDAHNLPDSEPADVVFLVDAKGELVTDRQVIRAHLAAREDAVKRLRGLKKDDPQAAPLRQVLEGHTLAFFECKTLITQKGPGAIHMSGPAQARKRRWEKRYAAPFWSVAFDDRRGKKHSGHRLYLRKGVGSVRLADMERVGDFSELLGKVGG